ncbi:MAG TPA: pyrroline-5-carboxylate reductase [Planctomycetota bacterium]|nr:pyrroline-5-carboxylate reductase [Planctomycetota bacterium]
MAEKSLNSKLLTGRTLGLLGAGNMAEALARGVIKSGAMSAMYMMASDVSEERRTLFEGTLGIRTSVDNNAVVAASEILVLCVKPQMVASVVAGIAPVFDVKRHLLASICAGVSSAKIEALLPSGARVVRVMPNTPMLVGCGASGVAGGKNASDDDIATIEALFATASMTVRVDEKMMDAVTGLSGSGPAYLFYLVEAMIDAGVAEGFTLEQARALASRTVLGAAKMLEETQLPPEELRRRVTSPNGTTQAAIEMMEAGGVKAKIAAAVRRAAGRSRELGR